MNVIFAADDHSFDVSLHGFFVVALDSRLIIAEQRVTDKPGQIHVQCSEGMSHGIAGIENAYIITYFDRSRSRRHGTGMSRPEVC